MLEFNFYSCSHYKVVFEQPFLKSNVSFRYSKFTLTVPLNTEEMCKKQKKAGSVWLVYSVSKLNTKIYSDLPIYFHHNAYVTFCAIWHHLYNLTNVKNIHGGMLLVCNFTKSNTPPWVIFLFFKLYKWYQIVESITYILA